SFDRLRANGSHTAIVKNFPFVLSLSKHERHSPTTSHLGKLYLMSLLIAGIGGDIRGGVTGRGRYAFWSCGYFFFGIRLVRRRVSCRVPVQVSNLRKDGSWDM